MAKFKFKYKGDIKDLEKVSKDVTKIMEETLLEGANVAADSLRSTAKGLRTADKYAWGNQKRYASKAEKAELLANMGYSPEGTKGSLIDRKAGFEGYTKKGFPIPKLANFINVGAGYQLKQPFLDTATSKARKTAKERMNKKIDEEINKRLKREG